jgi:hypothetical protein
MTLLRRPLAVALVVGAVLAIGAPAASADIVLPSAVPGSFAPFPGVAGFDMPTGGCVTSTIGQGRANGNTVQSCTAGGLSFIGPSSSVSNVVGPTIIAASVVGPPIVAGGNVAIGP